MKRSLILRLPTALLAAGIALSAFAGCTGGGRPNGTDTGTMPTTDLTVPATESTPEPATEPETVAPEDIPKTDNYVLTTDIRLPAYTYDTANGDGNFTGILPSSRDVWTDTWVVTDGADRSIASWTETPTPNAGQVGLFYFLWRDRDQTSLNEIPATDHFKAWLEGGDDGLWAAMQEGGEGHPHYWAEPYFGYYSSNDEWVLRKHAYMFAEAGVDFVFFDTTNNNLHTVSHMALMKVWEQVRQEGYETPKICFLCGGYDAEFHELYNSIYKKGLYGDLWYYWNGKPLVMTSATVNFTEEERAFFTWRESWADTRQSWYQTKRGNACWPWNDGFPMSWGKSETGEKEQLVVMAGGGGQVGRSCGQRNLYPTYEGDWDFGFALLESATPYGLMFAKYFDRVLEQNPRLVMITGWNEWIAGRWSGAGAGAGATGLTFAGQYIVSNDPTKKENSYFVDEFNPEYSRDIEPMKGGFGDNYFYQMAEYIRLYKGSRAVETAFGQWAIDLDGSVGQWYAVGPEYRDFEGDTVDRMSPGHVGGAEYGMYVNFSGRNDLVTAKVSSDSGYLYFYVECAEDITEPTGTNWMNLFINSDCTDATGWYGYDFLLNRAQSGSTVSVERFVGTDTWELEKVGTAEYRRNGKTLVIKVAKDLIGFTGTMDFKWADNSVPTADIMEFLDQGDAAPNGRYNYRYTLEETQPKLPACLTSDMIVLKANSYHAFVDGKQVRLVENSTKGVLLASGNELWLPVSFLASVGVTADGTQTVDHYGIPYVRADTLITAAGRKITVCNNGLVVIADAAITDTDTLTILYRALP